MKLESIETFSTRYVGFVRVTDETGATGWGQLSTYNSDISALVLHRQVAPWTLGVEITDLDDHLDIITEREHKFPGSYLRRAIGNAGDYLEFSIEGADYSPWQYGLFRNDPYRIVDGKATVTDEPGWGMEIEPEWLAKSTYQISERN